MANKQSVSVVKIDSSQFLRTNRAADKPIITQVPMVEENDKISDILTVLHTGQQYAEKLQKIEEENLRLKTIAALGNYRQQLYDTKNMKEFNQLVENAPKTLKAMFSDASDADFWRQNGDEILKRNQLDTEKIRADKYLEFGKKSLEELLENTQKAVVASEQINKEELINQGVYEIENSSFLTEEEKAVYKRNYLHNGILNLALSDLSKAENLREKYFSDDVSFKQQIDEIKELKDSDLKQQEEKNQNEDYLQNLLKNFYSWAEKERGNIDQAQYKVLLDNENQAQLWKNTEKWSETPLADAYKMIKNKHAYQEQAEGNDVRDIGGYLMNAYQQKKLSLDDASTAFSRLINPLSDSHNDEYAYQLLDKIFALDTTNDSEDGKLFMEKKAELFFDVYNVYEAKMKSLVDDYKSNGGKINSLVVKRFEKQVFDEIKDEFGFKTDEKSLSFDDIKHTLKSVYSGYNGQEILNKFYNEAPFVENKKEFLKNLALEEEKNELSLPRFYSFNDVLNADLGEGERFYYNGRMAVKNWK